MSFIKCHFNFNNFCNCSLNNWLMPLQNFSLSNFNFFNYNSPFNYGINNFTPYQSFPTPIFNYQFPSFNPINYQVSSRFDNTWNNFAPPQFNNVSFNALPSWANFSSPMMDTFVSTTARTTTDTTSPAKKYSQLTSSSLSKPETSATINRMTYGSLQEKYYKTALSYKNKINSDKAGNAEFSNGRNDEWCANMVTTIAHRTFGDKLPEGMPDGRKAGVASKSIAEWAAKHNRWLKAPTNDLGDFIARNVKPGDIVILDRGGAKGHAAIVTKVHSDGSFDTVEGNMSNSVKTYTRPAKINQPYGKGTNRLMGFVQMGDIA